MVEESVSFTIKAIDGYSQVLNDLDRKLDNLNKKMSGTGAVGGGAGGATGTGGVGTAKLKTPKVADEALSQDWMAKENIRKQRTAYRKAQKDAEAKAKLKGARPLIPEEMGTPLRAMGAYRAAWLAGKPMGGTGLSGMAMGAAGGIFVLQSIKDILLRVFDVLMSASPLLKMTVKILNIGFMQILRPFGDMVAIALKPLGKMMLQFSSASKKALKDAGLTPKDKEYYTTYTNMLTHQVWHMVSGKELSTYDELYQDFAVKGAEKKEERLSIMDYIDTYLGYRVTPEIANILSEWGNRSAQTTLDMLPDTSENAIHKWMSANRVEGWDLHPTLKSMLYMLEERMETLKDTKFMNPNDWLGLETTERDAIVAQLAVTDSNYEVVRALDELTIALGLATRASGSGGGGSSYMPRTSRFGWTDKAESFIDSPGLDKQYMIDRAMEQGRPFPFGIGRRDYVVPGGTR